MSTREFPKRFDFREAEPRIYQRWLDVGAFDTAYDQDGTLRDPARADAEPFVIVIPPPNITGRLHMGHALNDTVQDALTRYKRMDGFDALWVPGTDHAGIATQSVVKKHLDAQGVDYQELGREGMVERIWAWREQFGGAIIEQLRRIGCSCDWSRTRFTMDEGLNQAVRHAFVRLYEDGLIYRGKRIVNWCPVDKTALSDDEVDKEDISAKMYNLRYPFADEPDAHLVVSTTRPETLFGDVAVAVNPDDPEKKHLIGRKLKLPLQGRIIPIIGDPHADPEKGSGAVKITPAHDPNDFEVGQRHGLEPIDVMHEDATMNEVVPERFRGLDRYACRKQALEELEELGLLDSIDDHVMALGRSYRSKAPIEFRLSDQWFVKMTPLAEAALEASGYVNAADGWERTRAEDSGIELHPPRMEKIYYHWLSNIRDWCISRQIWWGHRIPAWYHRESGEVIVSFDEPEQVKAEPEAWRQDDDVLDTWFSSWLWPMSTLGWPEKTPDFERYYPTSVLSTAKDIIFFWVARMNFAGLYFEKRLPYQHVYFHSTIADDRGVTMSKSKGNGIDPLSVIDGASAQDLKRPVEEARPENMKELLKRIDKNFAKGFEGVGADGMRWTLVYSITEGEHVRLSLDRFTEGRNFVTKLWNASGRIITSLEAEQERGDAAQPAPAPATETDEDRWLLARLDHVIRDVRRSLDGFDFGAMAQTLYHFVWDDFASWALELSKTRLMSDDAGARRGALRVMGSALADILRLLHPVVPFVTEELWARLRPAMSALGLWLDEGAEPGELLCREPFPKPRQAPQHEIEERFGILQRFVIAVRQLRATSNIKDNLRVTVAVKPLVEDTRRMLEQAREAVCFLARMDDIQFVEERGKGMAAQYDSAFELYIDLGQYMDLADEVARLEKALGKTEKLIASLSKNLNNPSFLERAPADKVEEKRASLAEAEEQRGKLDATLKELRELV
ncbi:valine--tRNA ligase [Haliangium ochraceum]|uniref:Valine--tRNA ligase n=1 Tax=Haliangium ochraceum (strain DSM 14365 / JCM 11303 / SMP-2) TaxID=502025 RepID=D0LSJ2_HALO1|nr:valine--tRNA ligase [Haliangium ochraceum]ACY15691.1 valyl-tRNA synthetase [Haliangium ochraceum DSM 14365]